MARGSISSEMGEDGLRYVYLDGEHARDGRGADGGTDGGAQEGVSWWKVFGG